MPPNYLAELPYEGRRYQWTHRYSEYRLKRQIWPNVGGAYSYDAYLAGEGRRGGFIELPFLLPPSSRENRKPDERVNRRVKFVRGVWMIAVLLARRLPFVVHPLRATLDGAGRVLQVAVKNDQNVLLLLVVLVVLLWLLLATGPRSPLARNPKNTTPSPEPPRPRP